MKPVEVLIEADHVRRVLRKLNVSGNRDAHGFFSVGRHMLRVKGDRSALSLENLIFPAAYTGTPFLPLHVKHAARFFRIDQQGASVPTVLDRQSIQFAKNTG